MKDPNDCQTKDFAVGNASVACGQVLKDRNQHFAIVVAKRGKYVHLVCVRAKGLKVTRLALQKLVEEWEESDYPFEQALEKLMEIGKRHGITVAAEKALKSLQVMGREPIQMQFWM